MINRRDRRALLGLFVWMVLGMYTTVHAHSDDEEDYIKFHYDYNLAVKEARATGRPIFLEFRCAP